VFLGEAKECSVALDSASLRLRVHPSMPIERGQPVRLVLTPDKCRALRAE
jgi:hypothetical protein